MYSTIYSFMYSTVHCTCCTCMYNFLHQIKKINVPVQLTIWGLKMGENGDKFSTPNKNLPSACKSEDLDNSNRTQGIEKEHPNASGKDLDQNDTSRGERYCNSNLSLNIQLTESTVKSRFLWPHLKGLSGACSNQIVCQSNCPRLSFHSSNPTIPGILSADPPIKFWWGYVVTITKVDYTPLKVNFHF